MRLLGTMLLMPIAPLIVLVQRRYFICILYKSSFDLTGLLSTVGGGMPYLADALMKGGADEQVIAEFCCLADSTAIDGSPRYHFTRHLEWLSDMIVGTTTGPNKDMPLFELCHLVLMVDAVWKGQEGRWMAFLGLDKPRPQAYREWFHERVEVLVEETLTIQMSKDAVALDLGGTSFER